MSRTTFKPDHRRQAVANEAARLIEEQGLTDFRSAKEKAVERLGLSVNGTRLPSNGEIEAALAERHRIFGADHHPALLEELRRAALSMLHQLSIYHARLVGPVLHGTATGHSTIDLHLFSDSPESIDVTLGALGCGFKPMQMRHQFRRGQPERFPGFRFRAEEFDYHATVFTLTHRRRAPLSPVDGKPMRRAGIDEVEALLG